MVVDPETDIPTKQLIRYAEDGAFYLLAYAPTEHFAQEDYIAAETVAKLITSLADKELVALISIISGLQAEVRLPASLSIDSPITPAASFTSWLSRPGVEFPSFRSAQGQVCRGRQSPILSIFTLRPLFPTLPPLLHAGESRRPGCGRCRHKPGLRLHKALVVVDSHVRDGPDWGDRRWDGS